MKKLALKTGVLILLLGLGSPANEAAAVAPAPAAPLPGVALAPDAPVDAVLDALDQRGQGLKGFDANLKLTETDESTQLSSTRTGHVWYQKKPVDDARLRVLLDKKEDKTKVVAEKIEYLLDGGWLDDRDYNKRIEVRRQVLKPGEKINLLKLGEGPFPLPIGQKKEDVKKLFDARKVKPDKDDPSGTVHLLLKPIKGTQFARKFSAIDVWVDTKTGMPRRIDTLDLKETTTRSTELTDVRINPELTDADFTLPSIQPQNWNVHEEPFGE
jgi:outer membrane lipoprotein-sorting protein